MTIGWVSFKQTVVPPTIVAVGNAFTVTVAVIWQPFELVYVIMVVPSLIPVTNPELFIVANNGLDEAHGLVVAGVALPVNCVVNPTQTAVGPEITGSGKISNSLVTLVVPHSLVTERLME